MNILVVRLSSFGDVLFVTPALRALRNKYPDARIDVAVYDRFAAALAGNTALTRLVVLPKRELTSLFKRFRWIAFAKRLLAFRRELRSVTYDFAVDVHNVTDSALVALAARARVRGGHRRQLLTLFFTRRSRMDDGFRTAQIHAAITTMHYLVEAGCLAKADVPNLPRLEYVVSTEAAAAADGFIREQGLEGKRLAGINPGASYAFRRWSEEGFAEVARDLATTYGYAVILFGGPAERETVARVAELSGVPCVDSSPLPLAAAFALIARLGLFVSNDSGPMHVAAALGTPLVALSGPTNFLKFYPLSDRARCLHPEVPCRPCSQAQGIRCDHRSCFRTITAAQVKAAARELVLETDPDAACRCAERAKP